MGTDAAVLRLLLETITECVNTKHLLSLHGVNAYFPKAKIKTMNFKPKTPGYQDL